uniref:Uncharacterized protein n=1 Tax=Anguilla anguilla TaxID=7936 RepID=A0A0E9W6B7_ANGAN
MLIYFFQSSTMLIDSDNNCHIFLY